MTEIPADVLDELYTLPPDRFVPARDEAVAAARAAGDRDTATAIGKLRRPTVAAWVVNLLVRRAPEQVEELLELGEELRRAQHELRGEELRRLSGQRRKVIGAQLARARQLVRDEDGRAGQPRRSQLPLTEVEATLNAALADAEVAAQVREGRLIRPIEYAGFGETPRPRLRLVPGQEPDESNSAGTPVEPAEPAGVAGARGGAATRRADAGTGAQALREAVRRAETEVAEAEAALARAEGAEREATGSLAALDRALEDLRKRQAAEQVEVTRVKLERRVAQRAAERARRKLAALRGRE